MSATDATIDIIRDAVAPVIAGLDLDLYDIELNNKNNTRTLRVTVDRAESVDLDAITDVTRALSPLLNNDNTITNSFLLEMNSPNIERTLHTPAHYRGAHNNTMSLKVRTETGTSRVHRVLINSNNEQYTIKTNNQREKFQYSNITQTRTVFE